MALQLPLGYASGLPYLLVGETLGTWMTTEGINLKTVGAFTLCGLAYNLKILWAPLVDRYPLPFLDRRRGWLLLFQVGLALALLALAGAEPRVSTLHTALLAVVVAFFSASQDIVVDAYRADILSGEERAAGISLFTVGYRLGMLAAGAVALVAEHRYGWHNVYRALAASMSIGIVATLIAPRPGDATSRPKSFVGAYVQPLADLATRRGAVAIVAFVFLYRFGYLIAQPMNSPFLLKLGFLPADLGYWRKGVGLIATLTGGLLAGPAVARLGVFRAMIVFGLTMALIHLSWIGLCFTGAKMWMLAITVGVENVFIGLATTAFEAYMMALCTSAFSATQYSALTSVSSLGGRLFGATSGVLATTLGWPLFFGLTSLSAVPSLLIAMRLPKLPEPTAPAASEPSPDEAAVEDKPTA